MENTLHWKRTLLSCRYDLFSGAQSIGMLKENRFSQSAVGRLNDRRYQYRVYGVLQQKAKIIDMQSNQIIGRIRFNCWAPKAEIQLGHERYQWAPRIFGFKGARLVTEGIGMLDYRGTFLSGSIQGNFKNELVGLTGLFVANYYWTLLIIYLCCIVIPIFTVLYN